MVDGTIFLGVEKAMSELAGRGRNRAIGDEAIFFAIKIACTKSSGLGHTYGVWTNRLMTEYIREKAPEEYSLKDIPNGTVSKILTRGNIHSYKIR